jgi:peptidoglycan/LPS O-acetylase OafA/YrhL
MAYVLDFGLFALCLGQGAGTVLIGRPIRYLGTISYSAYFWHFVALWVLARLDLMPDRWPLSPWLQFLAGLVVVMIATGVAATMSYRLVEQPMIRIGRQFAQKVTIVPASLHASAMTSGHP